MEVEKPMPKENEDWFLKIPTFSIHPDSASRDDVARMAAELMELRGAIKRHEEQFRRTYMDDNPLAEDLELWELVKE